MVAAGVAITDPWRLSGPTRDFLKEVCTLVRTSGELCPERLAEYGGGKQKSEDTEYSLTDHTSRE